MATKRGPQPLIRLMHAHGQSNETLAEYLGVTPVRVNNLKHGLIYPLAVEIVKLEELFGLPIQVMFEAEKLKYHKVVGS